MSKEELITYFDKRYEESLARQIADFTSRHGAPPSRRSIANYKVKATLVAFLSIYIEIKGTKGLR